MRQLLQVYVLVIVIGVCASSPQTARREGKPHVLTVGSSVRRQLAANEVHVYGVHLRSGEHLTAIVEQRGTNVAVSVFAPNGRILSTVDNSEDENDGPELVSFEAKDPGPHRIEIRADVEAAAHGGYEIKVLEKLGQAEYNARQSAVQQWLRQGAIPLNTVAAGQGFSDMQPLKRLVREARLVSLGEATHGTREFFQLKHRILEFLVSEMGFTVFAIEASMPEAFDINQYLLTGEGDLEKALAGLYFWTWNTEEVLEMIRWMRRYNADPNHSAKVKFYGFDMQSATRAVRLTLKYLSRVDPGVVSSAAAAVATLENPFTAPDFAGLPNTKKHVAAAAMDVALRRFDERKLEYVKATSVAEWTQARQFARIVAQNIELNMHAVESRSAIRVRDRSMAENIQWILEQEGSHAKMVVWAHNGHVATTPGWMGAHLREMFGGAMVVFGFAFNRGSFQAIDEAFPSQGLREFHVGPAPANSLDRTLARAELKIAVADLHAVPSGPVAAWFEMPRASRSIGSGYNEAAAASFFSNEVVTKVYDAVLFVERTSAARALKAGVRPPPQRLSAPANVDFEKPGPDPLPANWEAPRYLRAFDFEVGTSTENPRNGKLCAVISRPPGRHYGEMFGSLRQTLSAAAYTGKRIRLRASVRTDLHGPGNQAHLWLRVMNKGIAPAAVAFYDGMADRPIVSRDWHDYELVASVPASAESIEYGLALVGEGRAWLDAVSLELIPE